MMEFKEFAGLVDARVRAGAPSTTFQTPLPTSAAWKHGARGAAIELVEPRNFRLTLSTAAGDASPTWYPIDNALVELTSERIAKHLSG